MVVVGVTIFSVGLVAGMKYYNKVNLEKDNKIDRRMAIFLDDGNGNYVSAGESIVPMEGYVLNTSSNRTKCVADGEVDSDIKVSYENGEIGIANARKPGIKCYFYFDKIKDI